MSNLYPKLQMPQCLNAKPVYVTSDEIRHRDVFAHNGPHRKAQGYQRAMDRAIIKISLRTKL